MNLEHKEFTLSQLNALIRTTAKVHVYSTEVEGYIQVVKQDLLSSLKLNDFVKLKMFRVMIDADAIYIG